MTLEIKANNFRNKMNIKAGRALTWNECAYILGNLFLKNHNPKVKAVMDWIFENKCKGGRK